MGPLAYLQPICFRSDVRIILTNQAELQVSYQWILQSLAMYNWHRKTLQNGTALLCTLFTLKMKFHIRKGGVVVFVFPMRTYKDFFSVVFVETE